MIGTMRSFISHSQNGFKKTLKYLTILSANKNAALFEHLSLHSW